MATLILQGVGTAIGGAFGGAIGAQIGGAIGGAIGGIVDQELFAGSSTQRSEGARLDRYDFQEVSEGTGLPSIEGRARMSGVVIWATRLLEQKDVEKSKVGGLDVPFFGEVGGQSVERVEYAYFANFAIAVADCEAGRISHFGRIWADGRLINPQDFDVTFYKGGQFQSVNSFMRSKDGHAPAYRGTAYVVFRRFPIDDFGRRIPNFTFEIVGAGARMESLIAGVDMIPASTEFGYDPEPVTQRDLNEAGEVIAERSENQTRFGGVSDWSLSVDFMQDVLPNAKTVALVVAWFGDDLRCGECTIAPRVEIQDKNTSRDWNVAGLTRSEARLVSQKNGRPAFGSTPDDVSVINAIRDLRARGLRVVMYPFIMMDIDGKADLPDPGGQGVQGAYPWRGRIEPMAGENVADQVAAFMGNATADGNFVNDWGYKRFIYHLADLAKRAGGVDAFLVGSEMRGMTFARAGFDDHPFVDGLVDIAEGVRSILPGAKISYAADWSEYHSHKAGNDLTFHLDKFWASNAVDFVGIDNYLPLSDWRPGRDHADFGVNGVSSIYDLDYLKSQIEGGEYWDYFYSSAADRASQNRTQISDGAYNKPWVFRQKAIKDWHKNAHINRRGGVEVGEATGWRPGSKQVWFTELGCPAINFGTNQPNVFFDPGSSESAVPYFSNGARDDFIQRQYLRASYEYWSQNGDGVVNTDNMLVWCWDARPFPEFPLNAEKWSDASNYRFGHWLNGRAGAAPAREAIERRLIDFHGVDPGQIDASQAYGQFDGYKVPAPISFRDFMQPFEIAHRIDAIESRGTLFFKSRAASMPFADLGEGDLIDNAGQPLFQITRKSIDDAPVRALVGFSDWRRGYDVSTVRASIKDAPGVVETNAELAVVSDTERMQPIAETMLRVSEGAKETIEFGLPLSSQAGIGDLVAMNFDHEPRAIYHIDRIDRADFLKVQGSLWQDAAFSPIVGIEAAKVGVVDFSARILAASFLDLPIIGNNIALENHAYIAIYGEPWPGGGDIYADSEFLARVPLPAQVGAIDEDLPPADRVHVWSSQKMRVRFRGDLATRTRRAVLDGANYAAIRNDSGDWEVLQYARADLVGENLWEISDLLRGQAGTDAIAIMGATSKGADFVSLEAPIFTYRLEAPQFDQNIDFTFGRAGFDLVADPSVTKSHAFAGVGLRPYAPAHLKANIDGQNMALSWVRRDRIDPDAFGVGDIPMSEASEKYQVKFAGLVQVVSSPQTTIDIAGIPSGDYKIEVRQVSAQYGAGAPAFLDISIE